MQAQLPLHRWAHQANVIIINSLAQGNSDFIDARLLKHGSEDANYDKWSDESLANLSYIALHHFDYNMREKAKNILNDFLCA
jgi:hypothetical protein